MDRYRFRRLLFDSLNFAFIAMILVLWIQNPSEDLLLEKMSFYSWLSLGLLVAGIGLSEILLLKGYHTLGEIIFAPPLRKQGSRPSSVWGSFWGIQLIVSLIFTLGVGIIITKTSQYLVKDYCHKYQLTHNITDTYFI